jgi:hypothetical protein
MVNLGPVLEAYPQNISNPDKVEHLELPENDDG